MKSLHKYIFGCAALAAATFMDSGCKKQLDINTDPNYPTSAQGTPAVVFPVAVLATTAHIGGTMEIVGGIWSQYFTQSNYAQQYIDVETYGMYSTDALITTTWDGLYTTGLKNYQYVIDKADSLQDWTYFLMGTVMKAYTAQVMVDIWDEIPYSQALQGLNNLNPQFDSGYAIYQDLITELDTAMNKDFTAITNSNPSVDQDPIFGGNIQNWIAFANTLKLKIYLRMVNTYPAVAQAGIQALWTEGATFLTSDAAFTNFTNNPGLENPFYDQNKRAQNTPDNLKPSTTFVSWLEANNDYRILYFFGDTTVPSINQGDFDDQDPSYAGAPDFIQSPFDPVEFISTPESYFLQAEAAVRYNGGAGAQQLYNRGVTLAFQEAGQDATSYIGPGGVYAWGSEMEGGVTLTPLQQIIRQKWASMAYGCHGLEAWFVQNLTGLPTQSPVYSSAPNYIPGQIVVSKNSVLPPGQLPRRLPVSYSETSRNTNSPQPVAVGVPVWWAR